MAAQVTLPGVGPVSRRALLLGGATAVVVMGVLWWRKRKSGTGPSAGTDATDTSGDQSGDYGTDGSAGGGGSTSSTSSTTYTTNAQWVQGAMANLSGVVDASKLAEALGLYITGNAVDSDQTLLIDQAIASTGYPPVSGPTGYPPGIRTQAGSTKAPATPTNLHQTNATKSSLSFAWDKVSGATDYEYWEQSDFGGSAERSTTGTTATWSGLMAGVEHVFYVKARNSAGSSSPAFIHAWTLK
jgi:hypothetical protein